MSTPTPKPKSKGINLLTDRQVKTAPTGKHADGGGLYLIVDASGARRWCVIYTFGGKRREMVPLKAAVALYDFPHHPAIAFTPSRRVVSRRKAPRDRKAGGRPFGSNKCSLSRRLGSKRYGEGPRRRNRSPDYIRGD